MDVGNEVGNFELKRELERTIPLLHETERVTRSGSYFLDVNTRELFWSPGLYRIFEIDPAVFVPTPENIIPPNSAESYSVFYQKTRELIRTGKEFSLEWKLLTAKGKTIWVQVDCRLMADDVKNIHLVGTVQDVTHRKQADAALQESLKRFEMLADRAPVMIWMSDTDNLYTYLNKPWLQMTGRTMEQELGNGWTASIHPDDVDKCLGTRRVAIGERMQFWSEYRLRRHDGVYRWILSRGVPRYSTDRVFEGYIGSCIDITERKYMEEEIRIFSQAVEQSSASIIITNNTGDIEYVNQTCMQVSGYSYAEIIGKTLRFLDSRTIADNESADFWKDVRAGKTWRGEFCNKKKNGEIFWESALVSPITDSGGTITNVLVITSDITEQKNAERLLCESNNNLRLLSNHLQTVRENERTAIAREVHDELGQLFTALKMEVMALLRSSAADNESLSPKAFSIIQMIDSGIQSVQALSSRLRPMILDDLGLITAIEWQAEQFEIRTGIRITLDLPEEDVVIGKDISTAVFRIIQESLTNIMRHAEATSISITVGIDSDLCVFTIQDNGKGISEAEIADTQSFGLIGIRERLRVFAGQVEFTNNEDGGMCVCARIPLHAPEPSHQ